MTFSAAFPILKLMKFILTLAILLIAINTSAQDLENQRKEQLERLELLRKEIKAVENKIAASGAEQEKTADLIAGFDEKLSLRKRLIRELNNDRKLTEKELVNAQNNLAQLRVDITSLDEDITEYIDEIKRLENIVVKRSVYAYKKLRWDELRLLFSSENLNQVIVRKKYFNSIQVRDKENIRKLRETKRELANGRSRKLSLEATMVSAEREIKDRLQYKRELIDEARNEERKLASEKVQKEELLKKLKSDYAALEKELNLKKTAAAEVEKIIANLIDKTAASKDLSGIFPDLDFIKLKGRMEWPVEGKIISRFGRQLNPELNTWIENTGIDIRTSNRANIHVVASGKITVVTWLRGYGTTMIINHPGGYYTVYAHLDEILANPGSIVTSGTVIAKSGEAGSAGGSRLHFELWEKKTKHNPEIWLKKKG